MIYKSGHSSQVRQLLLPGLGSIAVRAVLGGPWAGSRINSRPKEGEVRARVVLHAADVFLKSRRPTISEQQQLAPVHGGGARYFSLNEMIHVDLIFNDFFIK